MTAMGRKQIGNFSKIISKSGPSRTGPKLTGRYAPFLGHSERLQQSLKCGPSDRAILGSDVRSSVRIFLYSAWMSKLGPTLNDLHAEMGRTLVIWGWLEGEMIDAGINWRHGAPEAATEPLRTFLKDLAEPRGIRNAIAHGLASSHSDPWSHEFEPYITCRTLDAEPRKITLGDLHRTQVQLERLRIVLRTIPMPTAPRRR